ncbi:MAG: DegT/DnrJ/EryC1/StrS aminotransferase family protein [Acidobacteriota bacterium]
MSSAFIPFHTPTIGEEEIAEVTAVLRSGWLTTGPRTARFESDFAKYVQSPHALAVNSCTAGLHLALAASDIGPGDEVITTPYTFCATVNTILHVGATPVLADIRPDGNIDPDAIVARITSATKAIMPVHIAGLPCDMDRIWRIAKDHGLKVIEDAAHAAGSHYRGAPIGVAGPSGSAAVAFSFYATKNLTTGEGGMVTCADPDLADRMRRLCLHGISRDAWNRYSEEGNWFYQVESCGFKYNLSDLQSALGIHQLARLEGFIQRRTELADLYNREFADLEEVEVPPIHEETRHSWHLYMLRLNLPKLETSRAKFIQELKGLGIGCSVHFIPIPLHPFFSALGADSHNQFPQTLRLYERVVSLPLYPGMTEQQAFRVINAVRETARKNRKAEIVALSGARR